MRIILLAILFLGHFSFANEQKNSKKFLDQMVGKWDLTVSGHMVMGEQEPQKMHIKQQTEAKFYFDESLIVEKYFLKGKSFNNEAFEAENLDFFLFDPKKNVLIALQASSIYGIHTQAYKIDSGSKITAIIEKKARVKVGSYYEFLNKGAERTGLYSLQNDNHNLTMNMSWLGFKVNDFDNKIKIKKKAVENPKLKIIKEKHHKWVLGGSMLYAEFKGDKKYLELIGEMITKQEIRKYQFHSDGSVKTFKAEGTKDKIIWKKTNYIYPIPEL